MHNWIFLNNQIPYLPNRVAAALRVCYLGTWRKVPISSYGGATSLRLSTIVTVLLRQQHASRLSFIDHHRCQYWYGYGILVLVLIFVFSYSSSFGTLCIGSPVTQTVQDVHTVLMHNTATHAGIFILIMISPSANSGSPSASPSDLATSARKRKTNHQKRNLDNASQNNNPGRLACDVCRERKVRCDRADPKCGRCTRLDYDCSYHGRTRHRAAQADLPRQLSHLQDRLGKVLSTSCLFEKCWQAHLNPESLLLRLLHQSTSRSPLGQPGHVGRDSRSEPDARNPLAIHVSIRASRGIREGDRRPCKQSDSDS